MNQGILFNDDIAWHDERQAVCFTALVSGSLLQCIAPTALIRQLSTQRADTPGGWVELAGRVQFDLEAMAESLIDDEAIEADNLVQLG